MRRLPADLSRRCVVYDLDEQDNRRLCCGEMQGVIGEDCGE